MKNPIGYFIPDFTAECGLREGASNHRGLLPALDLPVPATNPGSSGYHRRSLVEATMFRLKRIFGFNLQLQTEQGRTNELITKMNLLNQMANIGRAEYFD